MRQFKAISTFLIKSQALAAAFVLLVFTPSDMQQAAAPAAEVAVIWNKEGLPPVPMALEFDPMSEGEAFAANSAIPFSNSPIQAARAVNLLSASYPELSQASALECMTAAVYHEAGFEPMQGRRAVAQVVLNRVKHPAFPNSVCGVVYQGSERVTGCQFTFTCDGSLARQPPRATWDAAKEVARAALSGTVEPSVGMATHYHANYVVPYWAYNLDKVVSVGTHIFYKWKGSFGRRAAFSQVPLPETMIPGLSEETIDFAMPDFEFEAGPAEVTAPPSPIIADRGPRLAPAEPAKGGAGLSLPPAIAADAASGGILADEKAGTLLLDD